MQPAPSQSPASPGPLLIACVLTLGVALRMIAATLGGNYDLISYRIVTDIMAVGGNVYQETSRYNYGPIWFNILHWIDTLPGISIHAFHGKIAALLTLVDIGLFVVLLKRWSFRAAAIFFLNPISIIITGYHSQFDNLAILVAFGSVLASERIHGRMSKATLFAGVGLSLAIKHLLFLFPLWLAMREKSWAGKMAAVAVPYLIFFASFVPYWPGGHEGIVDHVLRYASRDNAPFWSWMAPGLLLDLFSPMLLFVVAVLLVGLFIQNRRLAESLRIYLVALVLFSSAITNQYLAIPATSIAVGWNGAYAAYSIFGTAFLAVHSDGLQLAEIANALHWTGAYGYQMLTLMLGVGLAIDLLGRERLRDMVAPADRAWRSFCVKVKAQLTAPIL